MVIDNEIMNMDGHMLIEIVLWVSEPSKRVQVCLNNYTDRAITQQLNSIIITTKSLHNKMNILNKKLFNMILWYK